MFVDDDDMNFNVFPCRLGALFELALVQRQVEIVTEITCKEENSLVIRFTPERVDFGSKAWGWGTQP